MSVALGLGLGLGVSGISPAAVGHLIATIVDNGSGSLETVTCNGNHGLSNGVKTINGNSQVNFNGVWTITVTGARTFTFVGSEHGADLSGGATGTGGRWD